MANAIIVGMQWGDEGKGKIVDLICPAFEGVVRFQGGHNAGHTVRFADRHFSLHLIPSGILHPEMLCVLGNGMVVAPPAFFAELDRLEEAGVRTGGRLFVSNRAHALLPWHVELDQAREGALGGRAIGTTSRGIGPAYEAKASRHGLRLGGLGTEGLEEVLAAEHAKIGAELAALGAPEPTPQTELARLCREWAERLAPLLADTEALLAGWIEEGRSLLFEGAQGALLDLDHGTYPYVTSSSSTAGGACTGSGVPPTAIDGAIGVVKAYTTRVGGGPFPTELLDSTGEFLRSRGNEFGTTTGRPRRCGWLDTVVVRYARRLNGTGALALTKLDVLDQLDEIRVCTAYEVDGRETRDLPADLGELERARPVYRTVPGWRRDTSGTLELEALPEAARAYVGLIEEEVGARVDLISTGPRREETLIRTGGILEELLGERFTAVLASRGA
ncbi:MAG TPA: adenylosuccinate synthase [Thermoanaerobaculia bacterium]|nr:adenylosuccinate synthase [Thermoanaerobaculia bacterium]